MISNWLSKPYRTYLSLGSEIALLLSLHIILGSYIDEYFEVKTLGLISGALLGIILFFFSNISLTEKSKIRWED